MNIEEKLTASIISAIKMLYGQEVPVKMERKTANCLH